MENFEYYNPVTVLFGEGTLTQVGQKAAEIGKKALLVSYENPVFFRDTIEIIHDKLTESGVSFTDFFAVDPD